VREAYFQIREGTSHWRGASSEKFKVIVLTLGREKKAIFALRGEGGLHQWRRERMGEPRSVLG